MAIGYIEFKTPQEMETYLNSKVTSQIMLNGQQKTIGFWYTHREIAEYIDRAKLRVYESFRCPELDY
jgi:hypothetical protein